MARSTPCAAPLVYLVSRCRFATMEDVTKSRLAATPVGGVCWHAGHRQPLFRPVQADTFRRILHLLSDVGCCDALRPATRFFTSLTRRTESTHRPLQALAALRL